MKKIIFCLQTMILGGVEKELITIINRMDPNEYDVTLLVCYESDSYIMQQIAPYVRIINLGLDKEYYFSDCISLCKAKIRKNKWLEAGNILLRRVLRIGMAHVNQDISEIPCCGELYDVAICYHVHSPFVVRYVVEKTKANKKIAWIHNEFRAARYPINRLQRYLLFYQEIIAVSDVVKAEFEQYCPLMKERVYRCHNIIDKSEVIDKSREKINESVYFEEHAPKLLTIGRMTYQKGYDLAIRAAQLLKERNVIFKWYFVGAGENAEKYRELIVKCKVEDRVVMLGRKNNPYPYLKECDLYVQPSRHEAYGLVVAEARVLNKPIICSRFAGAEEQITDGKNGRIISVGDIHELADVIQEVLSDKEMKNAFIARLQNEAQEDEDWKRIKEHFDSL